MIKSTTPTIRLHVKNEDFDMSTIDICHVTLENDSGRNTILIENPEIDEDNKIIWFTLTQEQSSQFETGNLVLQVKIKCGDTVIASRIITTTLQDILEREFL